MVGLTKGSLFSWLGHSGKRSSPMGSIAFKPLLGVPLRLLGCRTMVPDELPLPLESGDVLAVDGCPEEELAEYCRVDACVD